MVHPHHDISIRKRIHTKKQKYPHPNKAIALLDRFIIALGLFNVIATMPQLLEIWISKDASGVSAITWVYYTFFSAMLFVYGLVHKEKPIIINYSVVVIMYLGIAIGAIIY
jgi:uncharacterized protein with PQ loop repeat